MIERILKLTVAALVSTATFAQAEPLSLDDISSYFNSMTTLKTEFEQLNDDGSVSRGRLYIRRPGRIRFEYDRPDDSLVISGEGQVAIFDNKSNAPPEKFPLVKTPLYLILGPEVDLDAEKFVTAVRSDEEATSVLIQDIEHPEIGTMQLVFANDPVALRQWIIMDGSGQRTQVNLGDLELGMSLHPRLFKIDDEEKKRGF
ncbi:MAG: outer membrane lipoprotein carrier protein LolA [Paracoccaceae bacterium]|nr:outer membrane lipoprotein carrier protein LolA [Paracoccaceae bacterium]